MWIDNNRSIDSRVISVYFTFPPILVRFTVNSLRRMISCVKSGWGFFPVFSVTHAKVGTKREKTCWKKVECFLSRRVFRVES